MDLVKFDQATSQQLFQILTKASLEALSAGDILQGRVQSLTNGLLLIKLTDGTAFSAKVPENFSASIGESITLEIGDHQSDQLTARILSQEIIAPKLTSSNQEEYKLAEIIGRDISSQGVSPTKELITDVLALLKAEPEIPIDKAAFLVCNKMEPDPEMLKILQKISENEFNLHDNIQSLQEGLVKGLTQIDSEARKNIIKPLIISQELDSLSQELNQILSKVQPEIKDTIIQNIKEVLTRTLLDETNVREGKSDTSEVLVFEQKAFQQIVRSALETKVNKEPEIEGGLSRFNPSELDNILKDINKALENNHTKTIDKLQSETKDVEKILEKFFDKAIIKAENGEIQDIIDIKEKTEALKKVMEFSQKAISQMDKQTQDTIQPAFKEISQAFRFFNQVTTYDSMMQIPLKINRENTTGELYVMKRKNHKKLNCENFTLFLSLQTSNLGRIESFLNASHKCVTISFRVEQEDLVKLVKDQHRALYDGLLNKGYKLAEMKCRLLEDDNTGILDAAAKTREFLGLQSKVDLKI